MSRKYRVLVIAEAANPEWVSVPLVGWSLANAIREVADAHIVTQVRNAGAFERAGLREGVHFTAIDSECIAAPAYRLARLLRGGDGKGWTTEMALFALTYPFFEHLVWRRFGPEICAGRFDVVHRVTPLSPTANGSIARKCAGAGVPFVVGPLNGGLPWPQAFSTQRHKEKEWLSYVRSAYKLLPGRRRTLAAARVIIAGSRYTQSEIPKVFGDRVVYMPENGLDPSRFNRIAQPPDDPPVRLCFVGRLVPYKGPDMAVEAAAELLRSGRAHLDIVGDGPMMRELVGWVEAAGLAQAVTFHGWVDHQRVQDILAGCGIFLFPSVREFGGGAVLEAMALGLAPVVVDYGGPGELVAEGRGIAVPIGTREQIVQAARGALERLTDNPLSAREMGLRARAWASRNLTWAAKAHNIARIYAWAVGDEKDRPDPY